jgi:hypothetical protein
VGNGNTLTEKGRALGFPCLQSSEVTVSNQTIGHQVIGEQLQGSGFIHSRLAHGYLLYSELEHAISFLALYECQVLFLMVCSLGALPLCFSAAVLAVSRQNRPKTSKT